MFLRRARKVSSQRSYTLCYVRTETVGISYVEPVINYIWLSDRFYILITLTVWIVWQEGEPVPKTQRLSRESANSGTILTAELPEKALHEEGSTVIGEPGRVTLFCCIDSMNWLGYYKHYRKWMHKTWPGKIPVSLLTCSSPMALLNHDLVYLVRR